MFASRTNHIWRLPVLLNNIHKLLTTNTIKPWANWPTSNLPKLCNTGQVVESTFRRTTREAINPNNCLSKCRHAKSIKFLFPLSFYFFPLGVSQILQGLSGTLDLMNKHQFPNHPIKRKHYGRKKECPNPRESRLQISIIIYIFAWKFNTNTISTQLSSTKKKRINILRK